MAKHAKHAKPQTNPPRSQVTEPAPRVAPAQHRASHVANGTERHAAPPQRAKFNAQRPAQATPRLQIPPVPQGAAAPEDARRTHPASHTAPVGARPAIHPNARSQQQERSFQPPYESHCPVLTLEQRQQHAAWAQAPEIQQVPTRRKPGCLLPITLIVLALIAAAAAIVVLRPGFAEPMIEGIAGRGGNAEAAAAQDTEPATQTQAPAAGTSDMAVRDNAVTEQAKAADRSKELHKCRLLAKCEGVDIYSPIPQDQINGVIMHQASYEWAQVMTTELPEADLEKFEASGQPLRVNKEQKEGTWVDADAAHLWRETDGTEMDTAVDVGADAGTTVYAPVTGTVLAVTDYDLYEEMPDVRIHIRPDANPDLDVVLLHQSDPTIKAGDHVVSGLTPIAKTRDIASVLTDVQLAFYTDTPGNHSHVQVNDLTNEDYLKKYDLKVS